MKELQTDELMRSEDLNENFNALKQEALRLERRTHWLLVAFSVLFVLFTLGIVLTVLSL
jgi:hypothetical protein